MRMCLGGGVLGIPRGAHQAGGLAWRRSPRPPRPARSPVLLSAPASAVPHPGTRAAARGRRPLAPSPPTGPLQPRPLPDVRIASHWAAPFQGGYSLGIRQRRAPSPGRPPPTRAEGRAAAKGPFRRALAD
jgi:hypothetical protein